MDDFPWHLGSVFDYGALTQRPVFRLRPEPVLEFLAEIGARRIQGCFQKVDGETGDRYTRLLERFGLISDSVHAIFFHPGTDFSVEDDSERAAAVALMADWVRFTADTGAEFLLLHAGNAPISEEERPARFACAAESVRRLAEVAEEKGIRIALENLPKQFLGVEPEECLALLEAINSPAVGISFDSGHANLVTGDPVAFLKKTVGQVWSLHVHDNHGEQDEHLLPGEGDINWPALLKVLKQGGYDGTFMLEWGGIYFIDARQRARAFLDRMRQWCAML